MTRVATYMSRQVITSRMLDVQKGLYNSQVQVSTGKKSQTYSGIADDSFRLINFENQRSLTNRYKSNNQIAQIRLDTMQNSVSSIKDTLTEFKKSLLPFASLDYANFSADDQTAYDDLQQKAFNAMKDMQYYLNIDIDGRYLFAGGRTDTQPVVMPWNKLEDFQTVYDGTNVTYAESRAADLHDVDYEDSTVDMDDVTVGTEDYGTILATTPAADAFVSATLDDASFGDLVLDSTAGTVNSSVYDAFSGLTNGMTLIFDGNGGGHDGLYTITDISADGRTLTLDPPPTASTTVSTGSGQEIKLGVPEGTRLQVAGSAANDGYFSVRWPAYTDMTAGQQASVLDGQLVFTNDGMTAEAGTANVDITSDSYYKGDTLKLDHRVDETRSVVLGINAKDAAFEKAIRGLAMLAQGEPLDASGNLDPVALRERVDTAMALITDAERHSSANVGEEVSDLNALGYQIGANQVVLKDAITTEEDFLAFLDTRMNDMENIDSLEAVTMLNNYSTALETSYAAMAKVQGLSLTNYL